MVYFHALPASPDRNRDLHAWIKPKYPILRVDCYLAWFSKSIDAEFRRHADHFDLFVLRIAFCLDTQIDRHAECVQILRDLADDAEALLGAQDGVFKLELRRPA